MKNMQLSEMKNTNAGRWMCVGCKKKFLTAAAASIHILVYFWHGLKFKWCW